MTAKIGPLGLLGVSLALLFTAGCQPTRAPRPVRPVLATPGQGPTEVSPSSHNPKALLWSNPVTYHGVEVRFELPAGFTRGSATIRQTEFGDRINSHDLELSYRYRRFEAPGGARYRFQPGSRVFVFRAPQEEAPWTTTTDRFEFTWLGNGITPVVREDRRDGSIVWSFRRVTLELTADRRSILYTKSNVEKRFTPPVTLVLDTRGKIVEEQSSIR